MKFILVLALLLPKCFSNKEVENGAVQWGSTAPDYSALQMDYSFRQIRVLLFVDDQITRYYDYDMYRVTRDVIAVVREANTYSMQVGLGLVVVDVLQTERSNLSLYSFQNYRQTRLSKLPIHDVAALMSYRYAGGLAFVGGLCNPHQSVILCGFYPDHPSGMGSIFFHELAHLIGVTHGPRGQMIEVPNCYCSTPKIDCLRIPGYEHDCTVQQLANAVPMKTCLHSDDILERSSVSLCGNGVREVGEDCDCGITCSFSNCRPLICQYRIHPFYFGVIAFCVLSLLSYYFIRRKKIKMFSCLKGENKRKFGIASHSGTKNFTKAFVHTTNSDNSVLLLLDAPPRSGSVDFRKSPFSMSSATSTPGTLRPQAPPPPPPHTLHATISVGSGKHLLTDNISWKFRDFDEDDEATGSVLAYAAEPGVPTCPSYPVPSPINRVTVKSEDSVTPENRSSHDSNSTINNNSY